MDRIKKSFFIAFAYVGFGTLAVLSIYPVDPLFGEWSLWGVMATFPVTFISYGYRYAESENIYPVLGTQFLMLLITWLVLYIMLGRNKTKRNKAHSGDATI